MMQGVYANQNQPTMVRRLADQGTLLNSSQVV